MRTTLFVLVILLALGGLGLFMVRVGIPNLVGSGQAYAGTHAASTLWTVQWAETLFRQGVYDDADGDGRGEFGTLPQLAGLAPATKTLSASLLELPGASFEGPLMRAGGYCFRVDLGATADEKERGFVAYAWPEGQGLVDDRLYCIDQDERILTAEAGPHVGCANGPGPGTCRGDATVPDGFAPWHGKKMK